MTRAVVGLVLGAVTAGALAYRERTPPPAPEPPVRRVVSLVPGITECLFAAGAGDAVVGVSRFCDYPAEAATRRQVGDVVVDPEVVLALRPDAVFSTRLLLADTNDVLRALGVRLVEIEINRLADVPAALREIGRWTGRDADADAAALDFERRVDAVRARAAGCAKPRVFVVYSADPLMTCGSGSYVDDVISAAGGENVFAGAKPWLTVGREDVLARRPDMVLVAGEGDGTLETLGRRVARIDPDLLLRAGPRLAEAVERLFEAFHGAR